MCDPVFPVATAKTQNVEKLRDIMPLYYYHFFRGSFTYKTYIPVIAYIIISAIFFFLLSFIVLEFSLGFYDDDPFIVYTRRLLRECLWEFASEIHVGSTRQLGFRGKTQEIFRDLRQRKRFFAMRQIDVMQITELYQISVTKCDRFKDSSPSRLISMTIDVATRELP